jgi:hypothetical protein
MTGAATKTALWVGVSSKSFRNCGAKALIKPQAAKHKVNEIVPNAACHEKEVCDSFRTPEIYAQTSPSSLNLQ